MAHLPWTSFFWYKPLLILSSTYWPFSLCKIKKKITADPELWGCTIFGPKMVQLPDFFFFFGKLLISFSSTYWPLSLYKIKKKFFHWIQSYEHAQFLGPKCPISQNDIAWETFLTITWEPDFSQACNSCRMLINLKNFHFTRMPEKTNDHFWPFLVIFARWGFFLKNLTLSHTTMYGPITLY